MAERGTAVVLGGGGIVGIAWELGVLEGLRAEGVEPADADLVVGTSAGAIVGALLGSGVSLRTVPDRAADLAPELMELVAPIDQATVEQIFGIWREAGMTPEPPQRAGIGALALDAPTGTEAAYVGAFERLLGVDRWSPGLTVTAVDVSDGAFASWDADAGVELTRAVAASAALPGVFPPVTVLGRRYMDGGVRSGTNADLAAGHDPVIVIAPDGSDELRAIVDRETAAIRAGGGRLLLVVPDPDAAAAIGPDLMDIGRVDEAFAAGERQGRDAASAAEFDRLRAGRAA